MSTYEARFTCLVYGVNMSQSRDDSDNHEPVWIWQWEGNTYVTRQRLTAVARYNLKRDAASHLSLCEHTQNNNTHQSKDRCFLNNNTCFNHTHAQASSAAVPQSDWPHWCRLSHGSHLPRAASLRNTHTHMRRTNTTVMNHMRISVQRIMRTTTENLLNTL